MGEGEREEGEWVKGGSGGTGRGVMRTQEMRKEENVRQDQVSDCPLLLQSVVGSHTYYRTQPRHSVHNAR